MYKNCTVGVVIPAYNEEGFVGEVIRTLPAFVDRAYVVDDCSTDGTWTEIQRTVSSLDDADASGEDGTPLVETIRHERNRGVGAAVTTGYRRALADGVDVTAVMNGDGQMDPAILDRIIDPVVEGRADYAKGNRLFSRDHVDGMTAWRRLGNGTLTFLTKAASGYWKTADSQNGYTAISHEALEQLDLDALYEEYGFCNDLLVRLNARGMRVADVEMRAVYADETSTIQYHTFIPKVSRLLLDRFLWRLKVRYLVTDFHPLVGLYLIGAVTTALGVAGMASAAVGWLTGRDLDGWAPDGAGQIALLGLLSSTGAMTLDMQENDALEEQVRREESVRDAPAGAERAPVATGDAGTDPEPTPADAGAAGAAPAADSATQAAADGAGDGDAVAAEAGPVSGTGGDDAEDAPPVGVGPVREGTDRQRGDRSNGDRPVSSELD